MTWKRTPQGYVITTATITRAGPIEYYGHELGKTGSDANKKFTVIRTLDELSKPETLASFNGLPFTLTHPDDGEVSSAAITAHLWASTRELPLSRDTKEWDGWAT